MIMQFKVALLNNFFKHYTFFIVRYRGEEKRFSFNAINVVRAFLLFFVPGLMYGISIVPPILFIYAYIYFLWSIKYSFLLIPLIAAMAYFILLFSLITFSIIFINILSLKYEEGEYAQNLGEKTYFRYNLYFLLYYPVYKFLNIIVYPPIKSFYLSKIGAKIGKNVFLALDEIIFDPPMIEIGDNTMIGSRAMILGHIGEGKLILKKTKIGNNCLIGTDSVIMPGAVIEDNVVVAAKSLVPKNAVLLSGRTYAGIPVKELKN